jgi:methionyl-tRNA formyltransferase
VPLRLVFFGTPAFAVPSLEALAATHHPVVAVVTQPDRPRGRGQHVRPSPVKDAALRLGIPTLQPDQLRDPDFLSSLRDLAPDLGVVAAYGKILPAELLALPGLGMINVHASLLPRWRGAAPVHRALIAGDAVTGVTIMRVVQALDAGPMMARVRTAVDPNETSAALEARLASLGAGLVTETVDQLSRGPLPEEAQDEAQAVYARRLDRADGRLEFAMAARDVHNRIRGLHPWPLASALLRGKRLTLLAAQPLPDERGGEAPGTILRVEPDAIVVATAPGAIRVTRVQLEGRPPVAVRDFLNGHPTRPGERFESLAPPVP